jgi:hypothetical protein
MGAAVLKSGSPISRWMTSWPAACSSLARASNAMTWKGSMARLRALKEETMGNTELCDEEAILTKPSAGGSRLDNRE